MHLYLELFDELFQLRLLLLNAVDLVQEVLLLFGSYEFLLFYRPFELLILLLSLIPQHGG